MARFDRMFLVPISGSLHHIVFGRLV